MFKFILNRMLTKQAALEYMRHYFANAPEKDRSDLWNILTGLRGPDNLIKGAENTEAVRQVKRAVTAVIRYEFLGEAGAEQAGAYAITHKDCYDFYYTRTGIGTETADVVLPHFLKHAKRAFRSLGLGWNFINHRDCDKEDYD